VLPTHKYRHDMPKVPLRIQSLPVDERGYPVPWFVAWIDGKPEFRAMDTAKFIRAIREKRCWVCGELLGTKMAFVIGPMCAINRISSEPPSHLDCALFSAIACPFLSKPHMVRRENDLAEEVRDNMAGFGLKRNPGVAMVWVTKSYRTQKVPKMNGQGSGYLLDMGAPLEVRCFAEGRTATRDEIEESMRTGLPALLAAGEIDGCVEDVKERTRIACAGLGLRTENVLGKMDEDKEGKANTGSNCTLTARQAEGQEKQESGKDKKIQVVRP